jgi:hypothetical protein
MMTLADLQFPFSGSIEDWLHFAEDKDEQKS